MLLRIHVPIILDTSGILNVFGVSVGAALYLNGSFTYFFGVCTPKNWRPPKYMIHPCVYLLHENKELIGDTSKSGTTSSGK